VVPEPESISMPLLSTMNANSRIPSLLAALNGNSKDPFIQYALALEYAQEGNTEEALSFFERTTSQFPEYVPSYLHYAKLLAQIGRHNDALSCVAEGVRRADTARDLHAKKELLELGAALAAGDEVI
jgi:thioredoxin-like negative regulator of GroEL